MGNHHLLHPTEQTLSDFSLGKLDDGQVEVINKHLTECDDCQRLVAEMASDSFLGRLRGAQGQPIATNPGAQGPIMSDEPGPKASAGTLPPDLADHPDYQIVRELGRGGMGVVYLAHNRLMGRDEVLKIVSKHLIERKGVLERFSREIRSAAKLMHPNIVHAYSAFRSGESVVFAMEYVDGLDLAKVVKAKGPMSVAYASYFVHQAALGLQHAHEQGMVHRDIKPGNLMLTRKGDKAIIKVLDFGLAKATRENPLDGALTHEGQMLGTPDFIAPEQIRDAQSAGIQADIYSLGCTLYYLLTGGPPFQAASLYDLLQAHFSMDAQPLNLVRPEVPAELAALVAKMMAKDAGRRFQTPAEVAEALKPFFKKAGTTAKPEVSTLEQTDISRGRIQNISTVSGPPVKTDRKEMKPADSPSIPSESQLSTLGEFKEPERSGDINAAPLAVGSGRRPRRRSLPVVAAASAIGLLLLLGVIIIIIRGDGRITIDTDNGITTITTHQTAGGSGGSPANAGQLRGSRVHNPPVPPVTPAPGTGAVAAASEPSVAAGSSASAPLATPPAGERADSAKQPVSSGVKPAPVSSNSIGMKLALIPAGEFMMGSPDDDPDASENEKPLHRVRLSAFYLGVYEVTQAEYEAVMGTNPSRGRVRGRSTARNPVECIVPLDAIRFCNALSATAGLTPYYKVRKEQVDIPDRKGPGYRLPTEAEWEYACRAGTSTKYYYGDDPLAADEYVWHHENHRMHAVGEKRPNNFGLYDMLGSVAEWCSDRWDDGYYARSPMDDPSGPLGVWNPATRGGSVDSGARWLRSARRNTDAWPHDPRVGFRVARKYTPEVENLTIATRSRVDSSSTAKSPRPHGAARTGVPHALESNPPESKRARSPRRDWMNPATQMGFVNIKGGTFTMGSPDDDKEASTNEMPPHAVRIGPFSLGVTEVTQEQYEMVMENNPSYFSPIGDGRENVAGESTSQFPVESISWLDAIRFCNAMSRKDGIAPYYRVEGEKVEIPDRKAPGYRLPTEAEWEYACRVGKTTRFSFGNDASALDGAGWYGENSAGRPHPVAQKRPNDLGLYDMHGNVWEWCFDGWDEDYYKTTPEDDPPGAPGAPCRVFRGGGWDSEARECRCANRYRFAPGNRSYFLGFRVARNHFDLEKSEK